MLWNLPNSFLSLIFKDCKYRFLIWRILKEEILKHMCLLFYLFYFEFIFILLIAY